MPNYLDQDAKWIADGFMNASIELLAIDLLAARAEVKRQTYERDRLVEALRHPAAPHIEAMLRARALLTVYRDDADDDEARRVIDLLDVTLDIFGYKHFTEGGMRHDEKTELVDELCTALATLGEAREEKT